MGSRHESHEHPTRQRDARESATNGPHTTGLIDTARVQARRDHEGQRDRREAGCVDGGVEAVDGAVAADDVARASASMDSQQLLEKLVPLILPTDANLTRFITAR